MKIQNFLLLCIVTTQFVVLGQTSIKKHDFPQSDQSLAGSAMNASLLKNKSDYNNPPSWEWVKKIGGSGADIINGMIQDENGNFFIAGSFSGNTSFDVESLTSVGFSDGFIGKLNPGMNMEWVRQISGSSTEGKVLVKGITIDYEGNLIVTGTFTSPTIAIGNFTLTRYGTTDVFIAKYDNSGNPIWAENLEDLNSNTAATKVIADDQGNLYVRASSCSIYKFSPDGIFLWESWWVLDSQDHAMFIGDFNILNSVFYVTGSFWQSITFNSTTLVTPYHGICMAHLNTSDGSYETAVLVATSSATQSSRRPSIQSFKNDGSGNLYLSGYFYNELSCGSHSVTTSSYYYTSFIAKISGFDCQWLISATSPGQNSVNVMDFDTDLNPVISGTMLSDLILGLNQINYTDNGYSAEINAGNGDITWTSNHPNATALVINSSGLYYSGGYQFNVFIRKCDLNGNLVSMKSFSSDSGSGNIQSIETDETGVYLLGWVDCTAEFFGSTHSEPKSELVIAKLNHNGTLIWHYFIENAAPQNGTGGDALVLDKVNGKLNFLANYKDTVTIGNQILYPTGESRNFIAQYSTDGTFSWAFDLGACDPNGLAVDNAGNIIASGTFINTFQLGNNTLVSAGDMDIFLAKFTIGGQLDWIQRAGGESTEWEGLTSTDEQANIYLTGEFYSVNVDFDGQHPITLNDGDGHIVLAKYNPGGTVQWVKSHSGTTQAGEEYSSWPCAIKTDAAGNSYMHGWFGKSNIFGAITLTSPYTYNYFVAKFDGNGDVMWAKPILEKQYGYNYNEIDIDEDGNCYTSGQIRDTCYFGDIMVERQSGYNDLFVAKYKSSDGTIDWIKTFTGMTGSVSYIQGIAVYNKNSLYLGGHLNDIFNFDNIVIDTRGGINGYIGLLGPSINAIDSPDNPNHEFIRVFPNPASSNISISFAQSCHGAYKVEIFNLTGQKVYSHDFNSDLAEQIINLPNLAEGTYIVKVKTGTITEVRKFIIE
jgi:hypothetical protein